MTIETVDDPSAMKIKDIAVKLQSDSTFPVYVTATIAECSVKKTKGGKPFLELILRDDSGTVAAKRFMPDESDLAMLQKIYTINNVVDISGMYDKKYRSINIECESLVGHSEPTTIVEQVAIVGEQTTIVNIDELSTYLKTTIRSIGDQWLLSLLRVIFNDQHMRDQFFTCPAAATNHHNYKGGLLHHVVNMLKMADAVVAMYPNHFIDMDILRAGIIVHDLGKIKVYKFENGKSSYIHPDKKLDHIKIGDILISGMMANISGFPVKTRQAIHGIIVSHHGKKEWGAIVEPKSDEEQIIHVLDVLDARFGRRGGRNDEQS